VKCCLWCCEKCLKFLNRNAYIEIAIYGKSFCRSAGDAPTLAHTPPIASVNLSLSLSLPLSHFSLSLSSHLESTASQHCRAQPPIRLWSATIPM
jgi:hypothetical protein